MSSRMAAGPYLITKLIGLLIMLITLIRTWKQVPKIDLQAENAKANIIASWLVSSSIGIEINVSQLFG